jgi:hypothetical protein
MNKGLPIILIAVGMALLFYGMRASNSFSSGYSRLFTGSPTDRTLWLVIGGVAAGVAGVVMLIRTAK